MTGPGSARYSSARVVVDAAVADVHPVHYAPYRINFAAILVESTRSQNITVTCRRSRAASGASGGRAAVAIGTAVAGSITGAAAGGATGAGQAQSPVRRWRARACSPLTVANAVGTTTNVYSKWTWFCDNAIAGSLAAASTRDPGGGAGRP
jgi:hypothetical protein